MPTTIEDRLVVGDESVVAELYGQHGPFIHTISQQLVGSAADRLTQQVFVDAWQGRVNFDPSLGTVRNWLVRCTRERAADADPASDVAVDRLVVADSLRRMPDVRRQVVLAGATATDIDELAVALDHPVAAVKSHLRQGTESLRADLADSRADGSAEALGPIMSGQAPSIDVEPPPEMIWRAIAADLDLDPALQPELANDTAEIDLGADGGDDVDQLRAPAEAANLDRRIPRGPLVVALVVVAVLVLVLAAIL